MARRAGDLYPLTIAAIFVVVLTAMWAGVAHSRDELVPEESIDEPEREVRAALWDAIVAWRADRGLARPRTTTEVTFAAQAAANEFAAADRPPDAGGGTTARPAGNATDPGADTTLEGRGRCSELAVEHALSANGSGEATGTPAVDPDAVAAATLPELVAADDGDVLVRSANFNHGLGVAVRDGTVHVVYRSCAPRRLSP